MQISINMTMINYDISIHENAFQHKNELLIDKQIMIYPHMRILFSIKMNY